MDGKLKAQIEGLLEKYTELLIGDASPELQEKVQAWVLYNHVAKSMPPLIRHWNELYPEAKDEMKALILEIQQLNEANRKNKQ